MIIPNTKRHPNNTKTDQLPISEVITGLPRPYHNTLLYRFTASGALRAADDPDEMLLSWASSLRANARPGHTAEHFLSQPRNLEVGTQRSEVWRSPHR